MEVHKKFDFAKKAPYLLDLVQFVNENNNYNDNEIGKLKIQENLVSYKSIRSINLLSLNSKPIERKK